MQNEFENKVREALYGVEMPPADKVWQGIAAVIGKPAKKRRLFLFFWMTGIGLLLAGSMVIFTVYHQQNAKQSTNQTTQKTVVQKGSGSTPAISEALPVTTPSAPQHDDRPKADDSTVNNPVAESPVAARPADVANINPKYNNAKIDNNQNENISSASDDALTEPTKPNRQPARMVTKAAVAKNTNNLSLVNGLEPKSNSPKVVSAIGNTKKTDNYKWRYLTPAVAIAPNASNDNLYQQKLTTDFEQLLALGSLVTSAKANLSGKNIIKDSAKSITRLAKKIKSKITQKFQWEFSSGIGVSTITSGNILGAKALTSDNMSSPITGNQTAANIPPAKYSAGLSDGLAASIVIPVSNHFSLSAGLGYRYYSSRSITGNKVSAQRIFFDSTRNANVSVREYFSATNTAFNSNGESNFTNRFHFVQMPLLLKYTMGAKSTKPVILSAGLVPSLLVGSRALYYDRLNNVSYVDKNQFNNLQLFGLMGAAFTIKNYPKGLVQVGPLLHYGFSNLTKPSYQTNQHLLYVGFQANILFKN